MIAPVIMVILFSVVFFEFARLSSAMGETKKMETEKISVIENTVADGELIKNK